MFDEDFIETMQEDFDEPTEQELEELEEAFEPEPDLDEEITQKESPQSRHELALSMLRHVQENLGHAIELLESGDTKGASMQLSQLVVNKTAQVRQKEQLLGRKVLEGVFDGFAMVGEDGNIYQVPANYASKSRLVEGDVLKLTVMEDGAFVYKQIRPVERKRIVGVLRYDSDRDVYLAFSDGVQFQILPASVSFHRGEEGDEIILSVPRAGGNTWAAVETIMKKR